jgi:hypothetical protein
VRLAVFVENLQSCRDFGRREQWFSSLFNLHMRYIITRMPRDGREAHVAAETFSRSGPVWPFGSPSANQSWSNQGKS